MILYYNVLYHLIQQTSVLLAVSQYDRSSKDYDYDNEAYEYNY